MTAAMTAAVTPATTVATTTACATTTASSASAPALGGLEAITAQHRATGRRLERYLGVPSALGTGRREHRLVGTIGAPVAATAPTTAAATAWTTSLALLAAGLAPGRFVRQSAFAIERLLPRSEDELLTTVHTRDALVIRARHGVGEPPGTNVVLLRGQLGVRNTNAPAGMPAEATHSRTDERRGHWGTDWNRWDTITGEPTRRTTHWGRTAQEVSCAAQAQVNDRKRERRRIARRGRARRDPWPNAGRAHDADAGWTADPLAGSLPGVPLARPRSGSACEPGRMCGNTHRSFSPDSPAGPACRARAGCRPWS